MNIQKKKKRDGISVYVVKQHKLFLNLGNECISNHELGSSVLAISTLHFRPVTYSTVFNYFSQNSLFCFEDQNSRFTNYFKISTPESSTAQILSVPTRKYGDSNHKFTRRRQKGPADSSTFLSLAFLRTLGEYSSASSQMR